MARMETGIWLGKKKKAPLERGSRRSRVGIVRRGYLPKHCHSVQCAINLALSLGPHKIFGSCGGPLRWAASFCGKESFPKLSGITG